jgi:hypothetical protein
MGCTSGAPGGFALTPAVALGSAGCQVEGSRRQVKVTLLPITMLSTIIRRFMAPGGCRMTLLSSLSSRTVAA